MAEAVAPDGAGVLLRRQLVGLLAFLVARDRERLVLVLLLVLFVLDLGERVAVPVRVVRALARRDQLGQHSRERVDLVAAERGTGGRVRLGICEHALEPEHEAVAHLPVRARRTRPRVHLGDRVVERATARCAGRQRLSGILAVTKERLARPRFCADRGGDQWVRHLRKNHRLMNGFLHVRSTFRVLQTGEAHRLDEFPLVRAALPQA